MHIDSFQKIAFIWAKIGQKIGFITNKLEASGVILRFRLIIVWDKIVFLLNIYKKDINGK